MAILTIHLSDEKYERLLKLAERRQISMDKLIDELSTVTLAKSDTEARFDARTGLGSREEGLKMLDILDNVES